MPTVRKHVPLDQALPGMVLADALCDSQGKVLLAEGIELTESTLSALRRHGIDALSIVAGTLSEEELAVRRDHSAARIERLFRKCSEHEDDATAVLLALIRRYRLGAEEAT